MLQLLVIDDTIADTRTYEQWLCKYGMQVMVATSAEEGIDIAKNQSPDVIITEIELPGMSGFQGIRVLKSEFQTKSIPIIILTNKIKEVEITWGLRQGASYYLNKPVTENSLVKHIHWVLPCVQEYQQSAYRR